MAWNERVNPSSVICTGPSSSRSPARSLDGDSVATDFERSPAGGGGVAADLVGGSLRRVERDGPAVGAMVR